MNRCILHPTGNCNKVPPNPTPTPKISNGYDPTRSGDRVPSNLDAVPKIRCAYPTTGSRDGVPSAPSSAPTSEEVRQSQLYTTWYTIQTELDKTLATLSKVQIDVTQLTQNLVKSGNLSNLPKNHEIHRALECLVATQVSLSQIIGELMVRNV